MNMMRRRARIEGQRALLVGTILPVVAIIGVYLVDHELAISILVVVILLLPIVDVVAAIVLTTLYLSRPPGARSVSLGLSTLVAWQTVLGLALTALPAYNRLTNAPFFEHGAVLVALGFTLVGVTPIYLAGWIILERRRRGDGTPPPEDGHLW